MIKKIFSVLVFVLAGLAGGFLAPKIWPELYTQPVYEPSTSAKEEKIYIQENKALKDAVQKVKDSAIGIKTTVSATKVLEGSGLILTSDGLAVTLADLVPSGSQYAFFVGGESAKCQIIKRDAKQNLALIKIDKSNLPTSGFFDLGNLKLGERIFLVSRIFDQKDKTAVPAFSVNEGIVKSWSDEVAQTNIQEAEKAAGSPVFDIEGNILGLTYIYKGEVGVIPINRIKAFAGL